MANNLSVCGVCNSRQISKPSIIWCTECDEGLCEDCKEYHSFSKGTKTHAIVPMVDYKKLPTEVLQMAQFCQTHNSKYDYFCRKHDSPCCKKCLKSHIDCKGLTDINEIIKNVKSSNAFYEIEQSLLEMEDYIKRISTNREENLTSLDTKKTAIESEIKEIRTQINHHLDKLQDDMIDELMVMEQKESSKIQKLLATLKSKKTQITEEVANVANIKMYASELQTFLAMKYMEKDIAVEEKFIQSIIESETTKKVDLSYQINESLQQIVECVKTFGEIKVCSYPCDVLLQTRMNEPVQIIVHRLPRNIDNISLTLQRRIDKGLSAVRGCSLLPDGRMVFSCYTRNEVRVLKCDGTKDFEINNIGYTFDVVGIDDASIAVTSGMSDQINIIDIKNKLLKKSIEVNSENDGVAYKDGELIYCARNKGLRTINLYDEIVVIVTDIKLPNFVYVTTFEDKLFYTNIKNHSVICCDDNGNIIWTFSDTSILETPYGISVDNVGNLFVVGYDTNNVVVISHDGQRYRQLLSFEDGLLGPRVLHYDAFSNNLLVANSENDAFLYEVK